jgi:hypothetical protein
VFQEQSTSFNLPPARSMCACACCPGNARLRPGIEDQRSTRLNLQAGQINKYRIAMGQHGLELKRASLGY